MFAAWEPVGRLKTFSAPEVKASRMGVGFEKLDRDAFDPEMAYDRVEALGVKYVRIQSGWPKTESRRGEYDFRWLDKIVDNLLARGLWPWMTLCYGNELYSPRAENKTGGVGEPPVNSPEALAAWERYCAETARHFAGRIRLYEVWNEPDGPWCWRHGVDGREYGAFCAATARAVRRGDPEAEIIGGSLNGEISGYLPFLAQALEAGMAEEIDYVTYHHYTYYPEDSMAVAKAIQSLLDTYPRSIRVIQGETGCPSRHDGRGALKSGHWTEARQAKLMARLAVTDAASPVVFSSSFTTTDMHENLDNDPEGEGIRYLGYFGLTRLDDFTPKPSYYAVQNMAALFREEPMPMELPILSQPLPDRDAGFADDDPQAGLSLGRYIGLGFGRPDGSRAYCYYKAADIMTTEFTGTVTLMTAGLPGPIRLIDPMDGKVYDLPEACVEDMGSALRLRHLPLKDTPLFLTFGDFAGTE